MVAAADEERVQFHHDWMSICYGWRVCGGWTEIKEWLASQVTDANSTLQILTHFLHLSHIGSGDMNQKRLFLSPEAMTLFFNLDDVKSVTQNLTFNALEVDEKHALKSLRLLQENPDGTYGYSEGIVESFSEES